MPDPAEYMTSVPPGGLAGSASPREREPEGSSAEIALEAIAPRGMENDDFDPGAFLVHVGQDIVDAQSVMAHVVFLVDLRIDGDHVAVIARLDSEAAKKTRAAAPGVILL